VQSAFYRFHFRAAAAAEQLASAPVAAAF